MVTELFKFSLVGTLGFVVDAGSLQLLVSLAGINPYASRLFSYLLAATTTWWLNRRFTFTACDEACWKGQWLRYLVVNAAGGGVNYGVYALCLFLSEFVRQHLYLGVAAGSLVGLAVNFTASRYLVFQVRKA
ncbi:MAG: GtrA family protein [Proteobacteria bacterium]|nr:GtrA family protein [Pseudomonadota bacterium]MBU4297317.1 GtrA family protein [Pseudomonadota bacterium]MCG2747751.1 GtrA family protein [Desulfobulbaceae bacterium]